MVPDLMTDILQTEHATFLMWRNIATGKVVDKTLFAFPLCQYPNKQASKISEKLLKRKAIMVSLILETGL